MMPDQRAEVGNQSLINRKAGHLAWYLPSGRSQGFLLGKEKIHFGILSL